jgi:hypothetical protein
MALLGGFAAITGVITLESVLCDRQNFLALPRMSQPPQAPAIASERGDRR